MYQILVAPPPPVINSLLHWDGHQPSARGFSQYWGLKSCRPINTLSAPVSAPSRLLHLLLPAGGLAHGFPLFHCLPSLTVSHTPSAPSFYFFIFPPTHPLSPTPPIFPLISYSFLLERSRLTECLNWKQAVGRLSVWGWSSTASDLPLPVAFLSFFWQRLRACVQRMSAHVWKDGVWKRADDTPDGWKQSERDRKRCKMKPACCSQVAGNNYKRNLTFAVGVKECKTDHWHTETSNAPKHPSNQRLTKIT